MVTRKISLCFRSVLILVLGMTLGCQPDMAVQEKMTLFTELDTSITGISFLNKLIDTEEQNIIQYLYFYNGGGVSIGDINNDKLPDIFLAGNQVSNKLYLNKGGLRFEDITNQSGLKSEGTWSTGSVFGDVNNDGLIDLYVCQVGDYKGFNGHNRLYLNQGDNSFKDVTEQYGLSFTGFSTHAAFFDYDLDGDLDIYLLNHSVHRPENYVKAKARYDTDEKAGDRIYRNDGASFTDVTESSGIYSSRIGFGLGLTIRDMNLDGWPDIFVSNDFHENDYLYLNVGDGTFRDVISQCLSVTSNFSMGNAAEDLNGDLYPDPITLDMKPYHEEVLKSTVSSDPYDIYYFKRSFGYDYQLPRNTTHLSSKPLNRATPHYNEVAQWLQIDATDWSWSVLPADYDNNGLSDLLITNGIVRRPNDLDFLKYSSNEEVQKYESDSALIQSMPEGYVPNLLFLQRNQLAFERLPLTTSGDNTASNGAAYADLDSDGDLDVVINSINRPVSILRNNTDGRNNWLAVRVSASDDKEQIHTPLGALVKVYVGESVLSREIQTNLGYMSSKESIAYFGLANITEVDSIVIAFRGEEYRIENTDLNQYIDVVLTHKFGTTVLSRAVPGNTISDQRYSRELTLDFTHRENDYNDKQYERLIPYLLSREGPGMAIGDVNGDDLEDVFVGGARGQASALFLQNPDGTFARNRQTAFIEFSDREITDALFADVDNDSDNDLVIVCGGNEANRHPETYRPYILYNNDGVYRPDSLRKIPVFLNASCISANDFNKDGWIDLFIGGRSIPGLYGMPAESFLLVNRGDGGFVRSSNFQAMGMITESAWSDLDGNGWDDLIIVGEWTPLIIFYNDEGNLEPTTIPSSSGLWSGLSIVDVDSDGDNDIIAGNIGLNQALRGNSGQGNRLYLKDFDKNNKLDAIITYFMDDVEYPFYPKDEIIEQLNYKRKEFPEYRSYAQKSFKEIFSEDELKGAQAFSAFRHASTIWLNNNDSTFTGIPLPKEAQWAPVFNITPFEYNGRSLIYCTGNIEFADPAIGTMQTNTGFLFEFTADKRIVYIPTKISVKGDIRSSNVIHVNDEEYIILGVNNQKIKSIRIMDLMPD
jgi:enediyne biosynthesis protein E4